MNFSSEYSQGGRQPNDQERPIRATVCCAPALLERAANHAPVPTL